MTRHDIQALISKSNKKIQDLDAKIFQTVSRIIECESCSCSCCEDELERLDLAEEESRTLIEHERDWLKKLREVQS